MAKKWYFIHKNQLIIFFSLLLIDFIYNLFLSYISMYLIWFQPVKAFGMKAISEKDEEEEEEKVEVFQIL